MKAWRIGELLETCFPYDKLQDWRGLWLTNGWNAAPALEFVPRRCPKPCFRHASIGNLKQKKITRREKIPLTALQFNTCNTWQPTEPGQLPNDTE